MKKVILPLLIMAFLLTLLPLAGGCLYSGTERNLCGVYGIEKFFYSDNENKHSFGQTYDYYLIIIRDDKSATVTYKLENKEEVSYDTTYTTTIDDNDKIASICIANFYRITYSYNYGTLIQNEERINTTFDFRPMRQDIECKTSQLKRDSDKSIYTVKNKMVFHKYSGSVSEKKIERAKEKQQRTKADRTDVG